MLVTVKPYFVTKSTPIMKFPLVRITKLWIVVRYNDRVTEKYSRKTGWEAGAFQDRFFNIISSIPKDELAILNKLAEDNGGTYEVKK